MNNENGGSTEHSNQELNSETLSQTDQRSLVFHLLYAADSAEYDSSLASISDNFGRGFNVVIPQEGDVFKKAFSIIDERIALDNLIISLTENWRIERLGIVTKLITRIALWEFLHTDLDALIIINEAIELAKCFGEKDSYKFINGILDNYKNRSQEEHPESNFLIR
ncbi:transcription antitermination factor NusB [Candidatus Dependentiae bacterium]|nr:transcription antitermination factor NusB [Candidatus Dependentiae bacterium]